MDDLPFENRVHLVKPVSEQIIFTRFQDGDIKWVFENNQLERVEIVKDDIIYGQMKPGQAPGYSYNAFKSGALANAEFIS